MERFRLDGKIALVTGAGSGLGRQFAETLAEAGAEVVLAARRATKLQETADLITAAGGKAHCLNLDVTSSTSINECFARMLSSIGVADIVVNNAGIGSPGYLLDVSEEQWDAVIDTNLKGVFLVAQAAAKALCKAGKGGSIVNIASVLGFRVSKLVGPYIAAKSGVVNLTKSMALEWARYCIRVNAIAPGYFKTEINDEYLDSEQGQQMTRVVPMRRIGNTEELSGPLLLLASEAGSFMTGSTITVDGGHLCSSL